MLVRVSLHSRTPEIGNFKPYRQTELWAAGASLFITYLEDFWRVKLSECTRGLLLWEELRVDHVKLLASRYFLQKENTHLSFNKTIDTHTTLLQVAARLKLCSASETILSGEFEGKKARFIARMGNTLSWMGHSKLPTLPPVHAGSTSQ